MMKSFTATGGAVLLALTLTACGSNPPKPNEELALTDAALQGAEGADARDYAPIELRAAREKKEAADNAVAKEDFGLAKRLSQQALADADLAKAKANAEKSRLALKEVQDSILLMRQEVGRATTN